MKILTRALCVVAVILLTALGAAKVSKLERAAGQKARNIIFVLADDLRFDALGFMGHPRIETPHIDSLFPLRRNGGGQQNLRRESGSKTADFPEHYLKQVEEASK